MSVEDILNKIGYTDLSTDGSFFRTKPIYRDSGNATSLRIHKETGRFTDFSEGVSGSIKDLIALTLNISIGEVFRFLKENKIDLSLDSSEEKDLNEEAFIQNFSNFFKLENLNLSQNFNFYTREPRNISKDVLIELNARFCNSGKMSRRTIFPIEDENGNIIGINGRHVQEGHPMKWKAIGKKKDWVFPRQSIPFIKKTKTIVLVEGISDILALYNAGVKSCFCSFGTVILKSLLNKIMALNPDNIIIATNNEPDNNSIGLKAANKMKDQLDNYFPSERTKILLPYEKDFGVMTKEEIKKWKKELINLISDKK